MTAALEKQRGFSGFEGVWGNETLQPVETRKAFFLSLLHLMPGEGSYFVLSASTVPLIRTVDEPNASKR